MAKKSASKKAPIIKFDVDFECLIPAEHEANYYQQVEVA